MDKYQDFKVCPRNPCDHNSEQLKCKSLNQVAIRRRFPESLRSQTSRFSPSRIINPASFPSAGCFDKNDLIAVAQCCKLIDDHDDEIAIDEYVNGPYKVTMPGVFSDCFKMTSSKNSFQDDYCQCTNINDLKNEVLHKYYWQGTSPWCSGNEKDCTKNNDVMVAKAASAEDAELVEELLKRHAQAELSRAFVNDGGFKILDEFHTSWLGGCSSGVQVLCKCTSVSESDHCTHG